MFLRRVFSLDNDVCLEAEVRQGGKTPKGQGAHICLTDRQTDRQTRILTESLVNPPSD